MEQRYLTAKQLAQRWNLKLRTVYNLKDKGEIPWIPIGGSVRFPLDKIEEYENTHTVIPEHRETEKVPA